MIYFSEYSWTRNIQDIITINFLDELIYYNIHQNNIYTDKVDIITICLELKSKFRFKVTPKNMLDKILIYLGIYKKIKLESDFLKKNVLIISYQSAIIQNKDSFEVVLERIYSQRFIKGINSLVISNCGQELCLKFLMNKRLKKDEIDIDKFLNKYGSDLIILKKIIQNFSQN
jgi:hypothetical protein